MASTWRGVVGPDITIVVRSEAPPETAVAAQAADNAVAPAVGVPPTDLRKRPEVEIHLNESCAVLLRHERGQKISESALRRVGFEVEEWLRGREERAQSAAAQF